MKSYDFTKEVSPDYIKSLVNAIQDNWNTGLTNQELKEILAIYQNFEKRSIPECTIYGRSLINDFEELIQNLHSNDEFVGTKSSFLRNVLHYSANAFHLWNVDEVFIDNQNILNATSKRSPGENPIISKKDLKNLTLGGVEPSLNNYWIYEGDDINCGSSLSLSLSKEVLRLESFKRAFEIVKELEAFIKEYDVLSNKEGKPLACNHLLENFKHPYLVNVVEMAKATCSNFNQTQDEIDKLCENHKNSLGNQNVDIDSILDEVVEAADREVETRLQFFREKKMSLLSGSKRKRFSM